MRNPILAAFVSTTLSIVACGGAASAAEYSGISVTYSMLPNEVVQPLSATITTDQFKARLKAGGTLILDGNELVIGPADPAHKSVVFMALDRLELKNGAQIVTNGNTLVLFVNSIASSNGEIRSFKQDSLTAAVGAPGRGAGAAGNPGQPGLSGGIVSLHVVQTLDGILKVRLPGQDGGGGGDGQKGATGSPGSHGADAQDGPGGIFTPGWCERGGQDGGPGGRGFAGGAAGVGGPGGDGGTLELINVGAQPLPEASYLFVAQGGRGAAHGTRGEGGGGGDGGSGGSGSKWCGGGHGGPRGPVGDVGSVPDHPSRDGADGHAIVKNLDLEVMVQAVATNSGH